MKAIRKEFKNTDLVIGTTHALVMGVDVAKEGSERTVFVRPADTKVTPQEVREHLTEQGASPEYVDRVVGDLIKFGRPRF